MIAPNKVKKPMVKPKRHAMVWTLIAALGISFTLVWFMFSTTRENPTDNSNIQGRKSTKRIVQKHVTNDLAETSAHQERSPAVEHAKPKYGQLPDGRWNVPGRNKIHNVVTNFTNTARPVAYRNGTEQALLEVFSRQRGDMPSFMPNISDRDRENLVAILLDKAKPSPNDDEWMAEDKEIINIAKDELRRYLKNGGNVDSFFEFYHNELMRSYYERKEAVKAIFDAYRTQDAELAEEFCKAVNTRLTEKGIRPINPPIKLLNQER